MLIKSRKLPTIVAITGIVIWILWFIFIIKTTDFKKLLRINTTNEKYEPKLDNELTDGKFISPLSGLNTDDDSVAEVYFSSTLLAYRYRLQRRKANPSRVCITKTTTVECETYTTEEPTTCSLPEAFVKNYGTTARQLMPRKDCTSPKDFVMFYETTATLIVPSECTSPLEFEKLHGSTISTQRKTSCTPDEKFVEKWKTEGEMPSRKWLKSTTSTITTRRTTTTPLTSSTESTTTTSSHIKSLESSKTTAYVPQTTTTYSHIKPLARLLKLPNLELTPIGNELSDPFQTTLPGTVNKNLRKCTQIMTTTGAPENMSTTTTECLTEIISPKITTKLTEYTAAMASPESIENITKKLTNSPTEITEPIITEKLTEIAKKTTFFRSGLEEVEYTGKADRKYFAPCTTTNPGYLKLRPDVY
ncbi:hypothetical protein CHUAL_005287 [Chamberlinius hualienensis]